MQSSVKGNVFLKKKIKLSLQESQQQAEVYQTVRTPFFTVLGG